MMSNFHENSDILSSEITKHKIDLIRKSWDTVAELGFLEVGRKTFQQLFDLDPGLLEKFSFGNMEEY